jgi:hypothetical protein
MYVCMYVNRLLAVLCRTTCPTAHEMGNVSSHECLLFCYAFFNLNFQTYA